MNYNKYKGNRWSISIDGLKALHTLLDCMFPSWWPHPWRIVEFGAGASTLFLDDFIEGNKRFTAISFENDAEYVPKGLKHVDVKIRPLLKCSDEAFEEMFERRMYMPDKMSHYLDKPHSRQKNCFYQVKYDDLPDVIDLMILDGPNGNGRSFAFLRAVEHLRAGSYIFIDDYDHYDFLDKLSLFYEYEVTFKKRKKKDRFVIVRLW